MKFLHFLLKPIPIPGMRKLGQGIYSFSVTSKVIFVVAAVVMTVSASVLISETNQAYLVEVPAPGGTFREGIVGFPRFINPLLMISDADKDLAALIYSGLLRALPDGRFVPDLAESYEVSADGLEYTFILKSGLSFHDGAPVTTDDVAFTIQMTKDPVLKSPKRGSFEGVSIEVIDPRTIKFRLTKAYAPFIDNFTLGILPKHIWKNATVDQFQFSQFNIEPIGSGPFKIASVDYNSGGLPTTYELEPFERYALGTPFIENFTLVFYQNDEELLLAKNKGQIDSVNGISAEKVDGFSKIYRAPLPRIFGLFFNQNQAPIFLNPEVRKAMDIALDRERIIKDVFNGYASPLHAPLPGNIGTSTPSTSKEKALDLLLENGWARNPETSILEKKTKDTTETLSFSIATANAPELVRVAEIMEKEWEQIGISVDVEIFEPVDLNQNVIRPRQYQAVLFGEIVGRTPDLYPFWHSSERNDPGFNIALYTNITVDKLLEDARIAFDKEAQEALYEKISQEISADTPAIFAYSPDFLYIVPEKVKNVSIGNIVMPSDRFANVYEWHIETEKVWKIFVDY